MIRRVGRPGVGQKKATGYYQLKIKGGHANLNTAKYFITRHSGSDSDKEESFFIVPSGTSITILFNKFKAVEQSYNWSSGTSEFHFRCFDLYNETFFDTTKGINEGTQDCLPENDNIFSLSPRVINFDIGNKFGVQSEFDMVSVTTSCKRTREIEMLLKFSEDKENITVQEPEWANFFDVTLKEF